MSEHGLIGDAGVEPAVSSSRTMRVAATLNPVFYPVRNRERFFVFLFKYARINYKHRVSKHILCTRVRVLFLTGFTSHDISF